MNTLNEYQQRYVMSILSQVDHHLDNVETLTHSLSADPGHAAKNLDPSEARMLFTSLHKLRAELNEVRDSMQVHASRENPSNRWLVITNLEFASVELQELTRAKLAGYGELDQAAFEALKTRIDGLQDMLTQQLKMLRNSA